MTTIPTKVGLTLLAIYWIVMFTMVGIHVTHPKSASLVWNKSQFQSSPSTLLSKP